MRLRNIAAPGQERAQELAAGRAALLGVKLGAGDPPPARHRREPVAVELGRGQRRCRPRRARRSRSGRNSTPPAGWPRAGARRSAVTSFQPMCGSRPAKPIAATRPGRSPRHSTSPSSLRSNRSCMPRQMPKHVRPGGRRREDRPPQAAPLERRHRRARRADAGDEHARGGGHPVGVRRHRHDRPGALEAGAQAAQVAGPVVDDDDVAHSCPWCSARRRPRRGSASHACRSASASDLNAASSRW